MPNSPAMRDPNAVIYLVPGVGMLSFAKDKSTARIASEFYVNAINVMRGSIERRQIRRALGAGSVQYRILAVGRGQAPAHAEAEIARRPRRAGDGRRRRHRAGDRGSAHGRRRLRRARRHRRPKPGRGRRRLRQKVWQGRGQRRPRRRDEREQGRSRVSRNASSPSAAWTFLSPTRASPPRLRSRTLRSSFGTAISRSSRPDISCPREAAIGS